MLQEAVIGLPPTPSRSDGEKSQQRYGKGDLKLSGVAALLSTGATISPPSLDGKPSTGLRLNPSFVGWMMGTPSCNECGREWTDPDCPHSVTAFTSMSDGSPGSTS